jgi:hypothetical protein
LTVFDTRHTTEGDVVLGPRNFTSPAMPEVTRATQMFTVE